MQGPGKGGLSVSRPHCPSHYRGAAPCIFQTATSTQVALVRCAAAARPPLWGRRPGPRFPEPNTAIRAPIPPTAVTRRREEDAVGRSLRTGSTHGAVRGLNSDFEQDLGSELGNWPHLISVFINATWVYVAVWNIHGFPTSAVA